MAVTAHRNYGAVGHRLTVEFSDEIIAQSDHDQLKRLAEQEAVAYCMQEDGYPKLPRSDARRLISQGLRGKPDPDRVIRRYTVWVRPFNRKAEHPWNQKEDR